MKKDVLQKLREMNEAELLKELQADKDDLWQLRTDITSGKVKNVREFRKIKKKIAVINTLIKEKIT